MLLFISASSILTRPASAFLNHSPRQQQQQKQHRLTVKVDFSYNRQYSTSTYRLFSTSANVPITSNSSEDSKTGFPPGLINIIRIDPSTYGTDNDQVMQVASYRNQRMSPEQMIAAQQAKRESFDPVESALEGIKIGLGIGLAAGVVTGFNAGEGQDPIMTGLTNFAVIGGTTASLLGYNNYSGNRVYVMSLEEARNRLTVDFVASLKISQDTGFAAYLEPTKASTFKNGRFEGCNGIVGCVDCQLRNSKFNQPLENGVLPKNYPGLPAHVHIKNMDVDETVRRKGIAKQLMVAIEEWARSSTDAELLTLEVRNDNEAAIRLYEGCGFVKDTVTKRKTRGGCSFMVKKL
jgi:ribosomal protein S18 acetylase RimI-like enzyme